MKADPDANDWERAEAMPNFDFGVDSYAVRLYGIASRESLLTRIFRFY